MCVHLLQPLIMVCVRLYLTNKQPITNTVIKNSYHVLNSNSFNMYILEWYEYISQMYAIFQNPMTGSTNILS